MNVFKEFRSVVVAALESMATAGQLTAGLDLSAIAVEPPRDPGHGDMATNAALVLAKTARLAPRAIAELLAERLRALPEVTEASVAGPGFLNWRLAEDWWRLRLAEILRAGPAYGRSSLGAGRRVNVEYVSANPTGPMHVGHCRGAVVGDALAGLLEAAGFAVTREYYINDAGAQVDVLARSAWLRYREALGDAVGEIPDGLYPGDYLKPVGQALAARFGDRWRQAPESHWLAEIRRFAVDAMMALIKEDLQALAIRHDVFTSERALHEAGAVDVAVADLKAKDLIYTGVLEAPKGKPAEDWEPRPQTLFRATAHGDDSDRPLQKSDGSWTYFAGDVAYHGDKIRRGFDDMIDVWGADHGGYVKRMQAAVAALSGGRASLDVKLIQMVKLMRAGEPVKMSKRSGSFVTLREIVDEVGRDVVRFIMLIRKNDAPLDFDFQKVTEQSKDNPVFYVQYAHARCRSVLRQAPALVPELDLEAGADLGRLAEADELALVRQLAAWPRLVESAAEAHEPHRVAFYLYDLASAFHVLWSRGNDDETRRFLIPADPDLTKARLALSQAVAIVIAAGLNIMGVIPVEELR